MLPAILICAFIVKIAAEPNVTVTLGTPKSCFFIGNNVKLLCAVSSESKCCGSLRIWQDNAGTNILTDGSPSDVSKYEEDYDNGTTGYNLIIKNVQNSDLGLKYKCVYRFKEDVLFLSKDYICDCWKCAQHDYGWSMLGDVVGTVIIVVGTVIILIFAKIKLGKLKTVLIVGGSTFIISAVVNLVALLIGYYACHCVDGTDPWLIVLGLGTSVITGVIALIIAIKMLKQGSAKPKQDPGSGSSQGSNGSSCWPPCKVEQEPKNPKIPSSNEQPVKEKKKKKPAAEKRSRSPTTGAKHIKTANNETELIPTEKGFSGDLGKKRPLPPLTNQPSPTTRPLLVPSTRPLPQITTN